MFVPLTDNISLDYFWFKGQTFKLISQKTAMFISIKMNMLDLTRLS